MTKTGSALLLVFSSIFLSACSVSIEGEDYQSVTPKFELENFFDGQVNSHGRSDYIHAKTSVRF